MRGVSFQRFNFRKCNYKDTMKIVKEQLNFNTVLIIIVGALVGFAIKKADEMNTNMIGLGIRVTATERRLNTLEATIYKR